MRVDSGWLESRLAKLFAYEVDLAALASHVQSTPDDELLAYLEGLCGPLKEVQDCAREIIAKRSAIVDDFWGDEPEAREAKAVPSAAVTGTTNPKPASRAKAVNGKAPSKGGQINGSGGGGGGGDGGGGGGGGGGGAGKNGKLHTIRLPAQRQPQQPQQPQPQQTQTQKSEGNLSPPPGLGAPSGGSSALPAAAFPNNSALINAEIDRVFRNPQPSYCPCMGTRHAVRGNCLACGKIACAAELGNVCAFCGTALFASRGGGVSGVFSDVSEEALRRKEKLLLFDRTAASRTTVMDDDTGGEAAIAAAASAASAHWLTTAEREAEEKAAEDFRAAAAAERRRVVLNIDVGEEVRKARARALAAYS